MPQSRSECLSVGKRHAIERFDALDVWLAGICDNLLAGGIVVRIDVERAVD